MDAQGELGEAGGLAYRSAGDGRPLVLLHPGPGLDGSVFFPEALALVEQAVRVVAFDQLGNGRSRAPLHSTSGPCATASSGCSSSARPSRSPAR